MKRSTRLVPLAAIVLAVYGAAVQAQIPAPPIEWGPWIEASQPCGGARYFASFSRYDGRNDPQVKLRIQNVAGHLIATRYEARFYADGGDEARRAGGSRVRSGVSIEGPIVASLSTGVLIQTPVNQVLAASIRGMVLDIETADVSKLPPSAEASTFLSDFRDFPKVRCAGIRVAVPESPAVPFIALTAACYNALPQWTQACNRAVDGLVAAFDAAPEPARACMIEWRQFQKCYEVYAFNPTPDPRPRCQDRIPHCAIPGR